MEVSDVPPASRAALHPPAALRQSPPAPSALPVEDASPAPPPMTPAPSSRAPEDPAGPHSAATSHLEPTPPARPDLVAPRGPLPVQETLGHATQTPDVEMTEVDENTASFASSNKKNTKDDIVVFLRRNPSVSFDGTDALGLGREEVLDLLSSKTRAHKRRPSLTPPQTNALAGIINQILDLKPGGSSNIYKILGQVRAELRTGPAAVPPAPTLPAPRPAEPAPPAPHGKKTTPDMATPPPPLSPRFIDERWREAHDIIDDLSREPYSGHLSELGYSEGDITDAIICPEDREPLLRRLSTRKKNILAEIISAAIERARDIHPFARWIKGERHMPFAVPMIWREPKDHSSDCYFCLTKTTGITSKSRHTVEYPDLPSAMRPVPHSDILPVPQPPESVIFSDDDSDRREQQWDDTNFEAGALSEPHLLTQGDLNDLVRDLDLSKKQSELLGSRLKGWNLLHKGTKVCFFRKRQDEFQDFYSQENDLVYCNDVVSLMEALGHDHDTEEWRLFIDSSKISMKAVLLHNGNKFPSVPIAHASNMKETYENMKLLLKKIEYERYGWKICSDLKVVALLRGLQLGYTKFCCFLCEWDSRDRERHYIKKIWPNRKIFTPGYKNIANLPLIDSENIYLPPLHIKLGLMKNFVKAMDRNASGFAYLKQNISSISEAKIKEGIFVGPQIRELQQDGNFQNSLNEVEAAAWNSFRNVCKNLLGSVKVEITET
ncbi:hypothetical protein LAZ67_9000882 [Cordylochernes scorpioides]|uniref:SAM domain-containing protein n=1 Tax=Cordylochernes scorpioides TaxID=51811 RepID=A0ABY6KUD5_9ARAC|nr:hypothetical protein LAZ67_9000882 [Cordylochernes scorpioides]